MPRIPKSEIDALKRTVSLLSLVKSQGYTVKKQGKDYAVRCPFHEEKTPSMVISPDKNLYHCFGCGEAGSVIDWQMKTAHQSLPDAVAFLRDGLHHFFSRRYVLSAVFFRHHDNASHCACWTLIMRARRYCIRLLTSTINSF
ncbi:DNA primase [Providencia rettgeri]|uniref:DNA primase n=1 Tax=Providencia rettgeri TaxID=587 RepID=A0A379LQC1_PRORE|nr:DNA primase [Providencia rettgeri]